MDQKSRLISLVKSYEFLYKNDSSFNKGILRKQDAWNKIGAQLNIPGSKCQMKWKNLKKWYKRAKLRRAQNPEGCTKKVRVWRYEKQLRFLDEVPSWKTPIEHDYIQPSSSISSQSQNDSNTKISSNIEIKHDFIASDPVPYATAILPSNTKIGIKDEIVYDPVSNNVGSSSALQNIEIKDEISESDSKLHDKSLTTLLKSKQKMYNYTTIRNESGSFHISLLQGQQTEDNCLQSTALENIVNAEALNLPQKQININNCFEPTTSGNFSRNAAKDTLPRKQQNVDKCFQSDTLQIVSQPTQKENKVDNFVRCTTISNIINPIFDENDNSSGEYQLNPISCSTSPRPPTVFQDLHVKIGNFLDSATATVNKLQKKPKNSTSSLFESLAKRITTSNLTKKQINDIEGGTCMLVYTDLDKFYLANTPPKL